MAAEPSFEKSTFAWIWDSVDVTTEELARFQPEWDIPVDIVVEADVGHRTGFDEVVRYGIDCARAGASSLHMHIRDEHDQEVGDPGVWREAIDQIEAEVGEIGVNRGLRGKELRESLSHLEHGLFASVPIQPLLDPEYVRAVIAAMKENEVVPDLIIFDTADVNLAKTQLFDTGVLAPPALWTVSLGFPLMGMALPDSALMTRGLTHTVELIRRIDPEGIIKICATGRASSYTTTQAMLMGLDIRPGLGETPWRHPHRPERLESALVGVSDAITVAEALGRTPVSPASYLERLVALR